jgi:CRP-like cAMP-binding protein
LPEIANGLPTEEHALLKKDGWLERHPKGHVIQKEGEIPTRKYIIHSGYASVEIMSRVIEVVGSNYFFGAPLAGGQPNIATLRALSPVVVMSFDAGVLGSVVRRNPEWALSVLDISERRVRTFQQYLYQLGNPSVEGRLAALYWAMSTVMPDGSRQIPNCINQATLASLMRITREEVNKKRKFLIAAKYLFEKDDGNWYLSPLTPVLFENPDFWALGRWPL